MQSNSARKIVSDRFDVPCPKCLSHLSSISNPRRMSWVVESETMYLQITCSFCGYVWRELADDATGQE